MRNELIIHNNGEDMGIKITDKILSISPYISTHWEQVATLQTNGRILVVAFHDGNKVEIPNLDTDTIHLIFHYHTLYLEQEEMENKIKDSLPFKGLEEGSIRLALGTSFDGVSNMMQHNPAQANSPDLPPEILSKIGAIAKIIAPADEALPYAELNCNCFFCQIAREFHSPVAISEIGEEEVKEEELQFQQWAISQTGDNLFCVVNRLDNFEKYNVFLGEPVGCTCGKEGCEHILAVLKS